MKKIDFAKLRKKHKTLFWISLLGPAYLVPYTIYTFYTIQTTWSFIALIAIFILTAVLVRGYLIPPSPTLVTKEDDSYALYFTPYKKESLSLSEVTSVSFVAGKLLLATESKSYEVSLSWLSYKEVQWLKQELAQA